MNATRRNSAASVLAAALTFLVSLPGCGTSFEDLCDDACDCEGCNDATYDLCVEYGETYEELAEDYGCEDEFDDYVECLIDTATCIDRDYDLHEDQCEHEWRSCGATYSYPF